MASVNGRCQSNCHLLIDCDDTGKDAWAVNEAQFRELISGKTRGVAAACLRGGLSLLALPYGLGVAVRKWMFECGLKKVFRVDAAVVSLGNLTTGGTGKTPFAAFLARWFTEQGVRVCFVSRGYGAQDGSGNDEALVLAQLCPDVPHRQQPDRVAASGRVIDDHGAELIILDDGFQHRRLHRDLDIVLIDALNPWGFGRLLPRGLLREPLRALRRADLIVITRADQATSEQLESIRDTTRRFVNQSPVEVSFPPTRLINAAGETAEISSLSGRPVAAFCGIGNPQGFRESLHELGLTVAAFREFPDHHAYRAAELASLGEWAAGHDAAAVLLTQKDLVKIPSNELGSVPLWAVEIGCRIEQGDARLTEVLQGLLSRRHV